MTDSKQEKFEKLRTLLKADRSGAYNYRGDIASHLSDLEDQLARLTELVAILLADRGLDAETVDHYQRWGHSAKGSTYAELTGKGAYEYLPPKFEKTWVQQIPKEED